MTQTAIAFALASVVLAQGGTPRSQAVAIGYCTSWKNVAAAKAAGFEYVELGTSEIAALSDAEFDAAVRSLASAGLPTPAANLFLPATLKVTGPVVDRAVQTAYVDKALDRLATLGVRLVVFGSGGARRVPDGFSHDEAFQQLVDFGRRAGAAARARGITIAVEPLRREETNIVNTAREGLALVEAVRDTGFELMIDFYHLASEHEDPGIIVTAGSHLRHVHMANPNGRIFPRSPEEFDYAPFFGKLREIDYNHRISVEASTHDLMADAPHAIALLRHALR